MSWRYLKQGFSIVLAIAGITAIAGLGYARLTSSKLLSVQSGSMVPVYKKGDLVAVTRVPNDQLKVGDVITFISPRNSKQTITHRLVLVPKSPTQGNFQTKGDANLTADTPITTKSILGKVNHSVPYAGRIIDFIRQPLGLALLIYIPAFCIIIGEIKILGAYFKKQMPYKLVRAKSDSKKIIRMSGIMSLLIFCLVFALLTVPVFANLQTQVTVTGNTISTINLQSTNNILIKEILMRCSEDNTKLANIRPRIVIVNNSAKKIDISGWKLSDNSGVIVTIENGVFIKKNKKLVITPYLINGFQYAGDNLVLSSPNNQIIDSLSWGSDISQLNPGLQTIKAGTKIKRKTMKDTNTIADWKVKKHNCYEDQNDHGDHDEHDNHDNENEHNDENCDSRRELDRTKRIGWYRHSDED